MVLMFHRIVTIQMSLLQKSSPPTEQSANQSTPEVKPATNQNADINSANQMDPLADIVPANKRTVLHYSSCSSDEDETQSVASTKRKKKKSKKKAEATGSSRKKMK